MKTLIIASSKEETKNFNSESYLTHHTGIGLTLAAIESVKAIERYKPDIVINVGSCGAMRKDFKIGDVVAFSEVYNKDQDLTKYRIAKYSTLKKEGITQGAIKLIGSDRYKILSSSAFSEEVIADFDAADMEAYSVAAAALSYNIPVAVFKLITDYTGEDVKLADYKRVLRDGRALLEERVSEFLSKI